MGERIFRAVAIITLTFNLPLFCYAVELELKGSITGKSGNINSSNQLLESKVISYIKANTLSSSVAYNKDSKDHITYSEGYLFKVMDEYKFSSLQGGYAKYEFYRDTFRGYRRQDKFGLGHLVYWNKHFKTRMGYKYYDQKGHLVIGYIFKYEIFKSKVDYVKGLLEFNTGLKFKLFSYFSLEFNYEHIYKDNPKEGFGKTDSKYYTMLVINI